MSNPISRLPLKTTGDSHQLEETFCTLHLDILPVTSKDIARLTARDTVFSTVLSLTQEGWPASAHDERFQPFFPQTQEVDCPPSVSCTVCASWFHQDFKLRCWKNYTRGIRASPAMLHGLLGVTSYLDNILVTGQMQNEHLMTLEAGLRTLTKRGVRVRRVKCVISKESPRFLGHILSYQGIPPTPQKTEPLLDALIPSNVPQLRSLLRLVNYYGKFVP